MLLRPFLLLLRSMLLLLLGMLVMLFGGVFGLLFASTRRRPRTPRDRKVQRNRGDSWILAWH